MQITLEPWPMPRIAPLLPGFVLGSCGCTLGIFSFRAEDSLPSFLRSYRTLGRGCCCLFSGLLCCWNWTGRGSPGATRCRSSAIPTIKYLAEPSTDSIFIYIIKSVFKVWEVDLSIYFGIWLPLFISVLIRTVLHIYSILTVHSCAREHNCLI